TADALAALSGRAGIDDTLVEVPEPKTPPNPLSSASRWPVIETLPELPDTQEGESHIPDPTPEPEEDPWDENLPISVEEPVDLGSALPEAVQPPPPADTAKEALSVPPLASEPPP